MNKRNSQSGFGLIEALIIILVVVAFTSVGWYVWKKHSQSSVSTSTSSSSSITAAEIIKSIEDNPPTVIGSNGIVDNKTDNARHTHDVEWKLDANKPQIRFNAENYLVANLRTDDIKGPVAIKSIASILVNKGLTKSQHQPIYIGNASTTEWPNATYDNGSVLCEVSITGVVSVACATFGEAQKAYDELEPLLTAYGKSSGAKKIDLALDPASLWSTYSDWSIQTGSTKAKLLTLQVKQAAGQSDDSSTAVFVAPNGNGWEFVETVDYYGQATPTDAQCQVLKNHPQSSILLQLVPPCKV